MLIEFLRRLFGLRSGTAIEREKQTGGSAGYSTGHVDNTAASPDPFSPVYNTDPFISEPAVNDPSGDDTSADQSDSADSGSSDSGGGGDYGGGGWN